MFVYVTPRHRSIIGPTREPCTTFQLHPLTSAFPQIHQTTQVSASFTTWSQTFLHHKTHLERNWTFQTTFNVRNDILEFCAICATAHTAEINYHYYYYYEVVWHHTCETQQRSEKEWKAAQTATPPLETGSSHTDLWLVKLVYRCSVH